MTSSEPNPRTSGKSTTLDVQRLTSAPKPWSFVVIVTVLWVELRAGALDPPALDHGDRPDLEAEHARAGLQRHDVPGPLHRRLVEERTWLELRRVDAEVGAAELRLHLAPQRHRHDRDVRRDAVVVVPAGTAPGSSRSRRTAGSRRGHGSRRVVADRRLPCPHLAVGEPCRV